MRTSIKKLFLLSLTLSFYAHGMEIPQQEYSKEIAIAVANPKALHELFCKSFNIIFLNREETDLYTAIKLLVQLSGTCKEFLPMSTPNEIKKILDLNQKALDDNLLIYGGPYFKSNDNLIPFFQLLIDMGARMDRYSQDLISYVKATSHACLVRHFINHYDNDVNQQDEIGSTPLHYAVQGNKADIVLLLLEYNANMYIENQAGYMPIINALLYNRPKCIEAFLKYGLDTSIEYKMGPGYKKTIAEWADMVKNQEIYWLVTNQKIPKKWYEELIEIFHMIK